MPRKVSTPLSAERLKALARDCPYCGKELVPTNCRNGAVHYRCTCRGKRQAFVVFDWPPSEKRQESPAPPKSNSKIKQLLERATRLG